jgi:glycerol-3-phosphate dehydrogenase
LLFYFFSIGKDNNMKKTAEADVVIFGGGIAGLWILNRLRQAGLSAILFESGALGGGQTHKSQGIIHGGLKYALQGVLTQDAAAMSDMPTLFCPSIITCGRLLSSPQN